MTLGRHLISVLSFTFISLNLLTWLPLLLLAALIRFFIPVGGVVKLADRLVDQIYRIAVKINRWWFNSVLGIRFEVVDEDNVLGSLAADESPLIISNHRSWFDVFTLQSLISGEGPILKFLIKAELLWVPILGWVCIVLNFPRLKRSGDLKARRRDLGVVKTASLQLSETAGALLLFPEGTRYTDAKRIQNDSPYHALLEPKPGGFYTIYSSVPQETAIIDVTIGYAPGDDDCWRCMSGLVKGVNIRVSESVKNDVDSLEWLNECWRQKEHWLLECESVLQK